MRLDEIDVEPALRERLAAGGHTTQVWPVLDNGRPGVLQVRDGALVVFTGRGDHVFRWSETYRVRAEADWVGVLAADAPVLRRFGLVSSAHGTQILEAVGRAGGPLAEPEPSPGARARNALGLSLLGGFLLQLAAVLVLAVSPTPSGQLFGVLVGAAGGLLLLLGVIGWGVVLGLRVARDEGSA
ncbi:hypothetical protein [Nocardioides solisilvae]|uniref:hypothetical protein n=1 Tax=Nocardioides solisilvae TaxID=1542435 RepID=UPI000D740D99|nr:hypothetical protein [Nocardioides solisilvae]